MPRMTCVLLIVVLCVATTTVSAVDPPDSAANSEASQSTFLVHEDLWDAMSDEPSQQLGMARQAFLSVDLVAAAQRLRKAATNMRITSNQADATIKPQLNRSADELDALARRVESRKVKSVTELDQPSARALHQLSRYHYLTAQRLWRQEQRVRTGRQLRAAADNLEHAARLSGQAVQSVTHTVVTDVRLVSGKLIEGVGYGVDEVSQGLETLGKQVESVGVGIEPARSISSKDGVFRGKNDGVFPRQ